jgi:demethylmenaquinone methyltransferase / 2-methoxy-6-polyprenyl-1,4-benzoquinol methylase
MDNNTQHDTQKRTGHTHFGFQTVDECDKARHVADVFDSVAPKYDLMNDLMSAGLHRLWKTFTLSQAGVQRGDKILDLAGGTGDLASTFAKQATETGEVWLTDINASMLRVGRDRLLNAGLNLPILQCDAQQLPFPDHYFDVVTIAFGIRNITRPDLALAEMRRVLKYGGKLLVLEFSKIWTPLARLYASASFKVLPWLGEKIAHDAASYRYLAESIQMHPDQQTFKKMMEQAGLDGVKYYNLTLGIVALHMSTKY